MTPLESLLKEQNEQLMEELEKAYRRIGALEHDLRELRQQLPSGWSPERISDHGAKLWIWEEEDDERWRPL